MTVVVEMDSVRGVFCLELAVVGINAEIAIEIEHGNRELLRGLLDRLNVGKQGLCIGKLDRTGRGIKVIDVTVIAMRRSHENVQRKYDIK